MHLWLFLAVGLIGGGASYLMIVAYRNSPAAVNASFDYSALIWGRPFGLDLLEREAGPDGVGRRGHHRGRGHDHHL